MSDRIYIFDTTLRDGEQSPGATMNQEEKIRLALQLQALGVDIIEAGFPAASQGDFEAVKAIAGAVKGCQVAGLCRALDKDIDRCWEAVRGAENPRIHTFLATSPLHMEYKLRKEPAQVLEMIDHAVRHAAGYTSNVEFSCEDASRSEKDFLVTAVSTAIAAGATTINIPDTTGYAQPGEFGELIAYLLENVKDAHKAVFSVHVHNDLGLGVANTLAALKAGARQAEVTLCGIGERAGNASLEEVVMALQVRKDYYGLTTGIASEQLFPTCRLLSRIIGMPIPPYKSIIGANAFAHESGIHQDGFLKHPQTYEIMTPQSVGRAGSEMVLGKHSGRAGVAARLKELGFTLSEEQVQQVFEAVKRLADKKKQIFSEDVEALVLEQIYRIPDKFGLLSLTVLAGNTNMPPTAAVRMTVNGEERQQAGFGVGPVDAVFNTIAAIVGVQPTLKEYAVNAITGGTDAQGEVTVKMEFDNVRSVGRSSDEDVIVASARAYINALNSLARKREERTWVSL